MSDQPADIKPPLTPPKPGTWIYYPELPLPTSPLFAWPPKPVTAAKWLLTNGFLFSDKALILLLSIATFYYLQPTIDADSGDYFSWLWPMYLRNILLMLVIAGGLQLYFHTYKKQGTIRKFDPRELMRNGGRFLWKNQVWDNIFYTLVIGVIVWTAYEALILWAGAAGFAPSISWDDNTVWFVAWILLIPVWQSMHFYWVHRFLHWKPMYDRVHSLHHKNVNIGPWSGLAMHPVETVLYLSTALIHLIVPSHSIHVFFHMQYLTIGAITSHTGFESLMVKNKSSIVVGSFFHQLHHRYFECNYGSFEMPWDRWFGSFHDGSQEATQKVRQVMLKRQKK